MRSPARFDGRRGSRKTRRTPRYAACPALLTAPVSSLRTTEKAFPFTEPSGSRGMNSLRCLTKESQGEEGEKEKKKVFALFVLRNPWSAQQRGCLGVTGCGRWAEACWDCADL
ncbi:hypothetical protein AAFF_G00149430 [Aldrovandia affinis]|uniref:Uncharacterized protein n=1 Tax=Aldrovandia affinis TaxID=143900 RepID=A0AAD7VX99_9TELE|nr:hypothetical protein AAFF_G00149430 [Aldrovandia affinis]